MPINKPFNVSDEIMSFHIALDSIHKKYMVELSPVAITPSDKEQYLNGRVPLLNFAEFPLVGEEITPIFVEVCQVIEQFCPSTAVDLAQIKKALQGYPGQLAELIEHYTWQNERYLKDYVDRHALNHDLFELILFNVAKPLVTGFARSVVNQIEPDLWYHNLCPVCGRKPGLAENSENQPKIMHCSLCSTSWPVKSLECPHCLNQDHSTLKYLSVENDRGFQVNVCDKCKGYIKTIKEVGLDGNSSIFITDLKTLYLDLIAQNHGYVRDVRCLGTKTTN